MRGWVLGLIVLALLPFTHASGPVTLSGGYTAGNWLAYDFGLDECERAAIARVVGVSWPQTGTDGQCASFPIAYAGHIFTLETAGALPPSEAHACFYGSTGTFLGCPLPPMPVPAGARFVSVSSPDGVLVTWTMHVN